MTTTSELARHFSAVDPSALPHAGLAEMRRLLLDYFGVATAGSQAESGRIAGEFVVQIGGHAQATVIGRGERVPAIHAAFANAIAEHSIELDDVDDEALFHYGPPVVSAALAVAEWQHASGDELLTAMLLGCEMMNRLSLATNPALRNRGFHTTPTCGVFGATVAAGRLLHLGPEEMTSALGLAGAQASGLMEMYGPSMQKRINPGPAARNGVTAAVLAGMGYTGADTILEGERGFGIAFSGHLDETKLLDGLGVEFPVPVEYKARSAARPIHNAIDCALVLRAEEQFNHERVTSIVVTRHPDWSNYHRNPRPRTVHEAQMSLPYSVAVALVEGAALPPQYADEQLARPELVRLSELVRIETDPHLPRGVSCRMDVTTTDGSSYSSAVDDAKGSLGNPMSDTELGEKFSMLASPVLGEKRAEVIKESIAGVSDLEDVGALVALFVPER